MPITWRAWRATKLAIVPVPVYAVREVEVKDTIKIDVYSDVTYYRYRVKQYIGGATESVWSTCDPVDESLINKGYKLTGKKKEA